MDVLKEFHRFLESLSEEQQDKNCTDDKCTDDKVFLEEYEACVLGAGTTTPFTNFVGLRDVPTVVISKHLPRVREESINENHVEGLEVLANLSSSTNMSREIDDPLPISSQSTVTIGQPLASNRVYLNHSSPFYRGWSGAITQTTTFSHDNGLTPLSLNSVRFVTSLYCLSSWKAKGTLPDLWVVCEKNEQRIIALGCAYGGPKRSLLTFKVEEGGVASKADTKLKVEKVMSTGTVFSEYDIMNSSFEETERPVDKFKILFAWSNPDGMLSSPPECSEAILKVSNTPGDLFSPVLSMYEELRSLYRLCKIASNGMPLREEDEEEVFASSEKLAKGVEGFIHEMAHPLNQPADVTVISPTSDHMVYEPRIDLDFVEQLWLLCHDVTSFDDLQLVFAKVFKAVLLRKVQPFVHRKSNSSLASLLRQVLLSPDGTGLQDAALKFQLLLTEARLLPCLIQIGIEKMKRDYLSFFVGTDICSVDQFEQFFNSASTPLAQCLELCRLHSVLELNATIMKILRLPSTSILSSFTKAAMEVFAKAPNYKPFSPTPVFSLPLPAYSPALKCVVALCSKLSPVVWCLAGQGQDRQNRGTSTQSENAVYLIRNQPLFRYLQDSTDVSSKEYCLYKCCCEPIV